MYYFGNNTEITLKVSGFIICIIIGLIQLQASQGKASTVLELLCIICIIRRIIQKSLRVLVMYYLYYPLSSIGGIHNTTKASGLFEFVILCGSKDTPVNLVDGSTLKWMLVVLVRVSITPMVADCEVLLLQLAP